MRCYCTVKIYIPISATDIFAIIRFSCSNTAEPTKHDSSVCQGHIENNKLVEFLCAVYCCIQALQTAQCAKSFFHARIHTHTLTHENKIQASIQVFLNSFKSCPLNKSSEFMRVPCTTASCSLGVSMSFDKQLTCHHALHAYYIHRTMPNILHTQFAHLGTPASFLHCASSVALRWTMLAC